MKVVGFVVKINSKSDIGRNGKPYTLWSMKLSDKEGNELDGWYRTGFNKPACNEGDYVQVTGEEKNGNVEVKDIKVSKNPPKAPAAATPSRSGGGGGGFSPEKDARITYLACRNAAIETVKMLLENDGIKLVKADTKAGAASRFDLIMESIDKVTVEYFRDVMAEGFEDDLRKLSVVSDAGDIDTSGDGDLPDADEADFDDDIPFGDEDDDDDFE